MIGVIGANESREPVKQALKKLSSRALPVITTSATYDDLSKVDGNYLPNVFPLAPPNTELAAHTAHWAKVGIPGALNQAKNVVVLMDDTENDLYTSDLGERFRVAFGAGARKATFSGADSIRPNVERICREMTPRPDLIFYAGRSTQFGEFHDAASNACHGITVIAGDAVTQFINDRISQLAEPRVKLFYTPLASEHSWSKVPQINQTDFYQRLQDLLNDLGQPQKQSRTRERPPSPAFAAMAHDAADALMQAAKNAYRAQRSGDPDTHKVDRAGVALALERLSPINGASGLIELHAGEGRHHPRGRPIILIQIKTGDGSGERRAEQVVVAQCGYLYQEQPPGEHCPQKPARRSA